MAPRSIWRVALTLALAGATVGPVSVARAAPTPAAPGAPTDAVKAEARERFDRGLGLFEKGDNAAALAEFKRAYELIANPLVLYNIGLVYAAMNRPVEATDALERFLTAGSTKPSVDQQAKARKVRDEQVARIAGLTVVTDTPATIEVDGIAAGHTPMAEPLRVSSGAHAISALAPGYQPARREVTLAGKVTVTVELKLVPTETGSAHLTVVVPVPGAQVWINGKLVGTTPLPANVAVSPGEVSVEIRRAGYRSSTRTLRIDEGANAVLALPLEEDPSVANAGGRLRVTLAEQGPTDITVDGRPRAFPLDALPLPAGPHVLTAARAGFEPYQTTLQIVAGQETSLVVAMVPTLETRARLGDEARSRRVLGWSLVGGGALVAAGAATLAIVTRHDVANAQAALAAQLDLEQDPKADCFLTPETMVGKYQSLNCAGKKASLQDDIDTAKVRRIAEYAGIGIGAIVVGIGAYLVASAPGTYESAPPTRLGFVTTSGGGFFTLTRAF